MATPPQAHSSARVCLVWLFGALLAAAPLLTAADNKALTLDDVKAQQAAYQRERAEAESSGVAKKFAPAWLERADQLAKKADAALAINRLREAENTLIKARWQLP